WAAGIYAHLRNRTRFTALLDRISFRLALQTTWRMCALSTGRSAVQCEAAVSMARWQRERRFEVGRERKSSRSSKQGKAGLASVRTPIREEQQKRLRRRGGYL